MRSRVDLRSPIAVGLLAQLLDDPDVQEFHLGKPSGDTQPVEVGVLRRSTLKMSWSYGANLPHALRMAIASLHQRPQEAEHG